MPKENKPSARDTREEAQPVAQEPDKLIQRLREMATYKYQTHTLHAPAVMNAAADMIARYTAEATPRDSDTRAKYEELLYAVGNKYPGETRHETALRYIRQAETLGNLQAGKQEKP